MTVEHCFFCHGKNVFTPAGFCNLCGVNRDTILPGDFHMPQRLSFLCSLKNKDHGDKVIEIMEDVARLVDPFFHVELLGRHALMGETTKDAYGILFGGIIHNGNNWQLAGKPVIHEKLKGMVDTAGPGGAITAMLKGEP